MSWASKAWKKFRKFFGFVATSFVAPIVKAVRHIATGRVSRGLSELGRAGKEVYDKIEDQLKRTGREIDALRRQIHRFELKLFVNASPIAFSSRLRGKVKDEIEGLWIRVSEFWKETAAPIVRPILTWVAAMVVGALFFNAAALVYHAGPEAIARADAKSQTIEVLRAQREAIQAEFIAHGLPPPQWRIDANDPIADFRAVLRAAGISALAQVPILGEVMSAAAGAVHKAANQRAAEELALENFERAQDAINDALATQGKPAIFLPEPGVSSARELWKKHAPKAVGDIAEVAVKTAVTKLIGAGADALGLGGGALTAVKAVGGAVASVGGDVVGKLVELEIAPSERKVVIIAVPSPAPSQDALVTEKGGEGEIPSTAMDRAGVTPAPTPPAPTRTPPPGADDEVLAVAAMAAAVVAIGVVAVAAGGA